MQHLEDGRPDDPIPYCSFSLIEDMGNTSGSPGPPVYVDQSADYDNVGYAAHKSKKRINLGLCKVDVFWANIFFAILAVFGQVGQNVSLPLWLVASQKFGNSSSNLGGNSTASPANDRGKMDAYFVVSFASLCFVVIFGLALAVMALFKPSMLGETERKFPHKILFGVGLCDALNGALVVFASPPDRTAPYLQAILGNFIIPLTILLRFFFLKKKPTLMKFLCGMTVLLALFVCLLPSIFPKSLDPNKGEGSGQGASGLAGVLWPICFMIGFAPAAAMNVIEEKGLKMQNAMSRQGVNIIYFLFWESVYQLICVLALFWVDIIPSYGFASSVHEFGKNWSFGFRCFFGGAGCDAVPGTRGAVFVLMYTLSYIGGGLLLRYAEGATLLAIVVALVTPLGFVFWTLFVPEPEFKWHPEGHVTTWYSIGALVLMVPAIFLYNMGAPEVDIREEVRPPPEQHPYEYRPTGATETDPLINYNKVR